MDTNMVTSDTAEEERKLHFIEMEKEAIKILGLPPSTKREEAIEMLVKTIKDTDSKSWLGTDHANAVNLAEVWMCNPLEPDIWDLCVNRTPHHSEVFSPALTKDRESRGGGKKAKTEWPEDFVEPVLTEQEILEGWVIDPITKCRFQGGVNRAHYITDAVRRAQADDNAWCVSLPERAENAGSSAECSVQA